jgi:acetyltransferase-like isoleucine patch superfamily enzyme
MAYKYINLIKKITSLIAGTSFIYISRLFYRISTNGKFKVIGVPILNISHSSGQLVIGKNVTLNSYNFDYHANMTAPIKIFIEGEGSLIEIGSDTRIHGTCLHARKKIKIGNRCLIAANCNIIDSNGHKSMLSSPEQRFKSIDEPKEIIIEDDVWIGMNSIILPGSIIGRGSIVAANSVVKMIVPPQSIVQGNPAIIVKTHSEEI